MKTAEKSRIARVWKPKTRYEIGSGPSHCQEPLGQPTTQALGVPNRRLILFVTTHTVTEDRHPQVQLMSHHPGIAGNGTLTSATHPAQECPFGQNRLMGVEVVQDLHSGADLRIPGADF
jgi:hypothetical protein